MVWSMSNRPADLLLFVRTHLPRCDHAARAAAGSPTSTGPSSAIDALSSRTDRPPRLSSSRSRFLRRAAQRFGPLRRVHGARSTLRLPTPPAGVPDLRVFAQNRLRIQRRPACCLPHRLLTNRSLLIETCHSA